ncbi:Os12g0192500, partial [Oryza sativa Japonica Group]
HPSLPSSTSTLRLLISSSPRRPPPPPPRARRYNRLAASASAAREMPWPHVLTVAGSDSGGGAGIQADIKACAALGAYCSSVVTAVTAQNTAGVQGIHVVPEEFIREQLNSVLSDMSVDVVKTGMLPSIGVVRVLCESLKKFPVKGSFSGGSSYGVHKWRYSFRIIYSLCI